MNDSKPIDCSFRIYLFRTRTKGHRYVAAAWNYNEGVFITSGESKPTYTEARAVLDSLASSMNLRLRWFDGEWEHTGRDDSFTLRSSVDG